MKRSTSIMSLALIALATGSAVTTSGSVQAADKHEMEKCYGVAKAGRNDCATATSSCAGTSSSDRQKDAYIAVPKGTCSKIAGGSLAPS